MTSWPNYQTRQGSTRVQLLHTAHSLTRLATAAAAAVGGGDDDGEDVGGDDDDVALEAGAADPSSCHTNPSLNPAMCLSHGPSPHPQTVTCFLIEPLPPPPEQTVHSSVCRGCI